MREQLIQYVNLLFAGAADSEDIKQEILQNTLDRFDDLISQGKSPEAAYRLAITGIGDINEILGNTTSRNTPRPAEPVRQTEHDTPAKKIMRAIAIALYILCALPLIVLGDIGMGTVGLCGTLTIVAVATVLIILGKKSDSEEEEHEKAKPVETPRQKLHESVDSIIWAIGLALYFVLSFATGAWYITWVLFPIIGSVQGLVKAIMDLKEENSHEK